MQPEEKQSEAVALTEGRVIWAVHVGEVAAVPVVARALLQQRRRQRRVECRRPARVVTAEAVAAALHLYGVLVAGPERKVAAHGIRLQRVVVQARDGHVVAASAHRRVQQRSLAGCASCQTQLEKRGLSAAIGHGIRLQVKNNQASWSPADWGRLTAVVGLDEIPVVASGWDLSIIGEFGQTTSGFEVFVCSRVG